jgi:hypothetical protein
MVWAQSIRPACTRLCARDTAVFVRQVSQTRRTLLGEPTDNEAKTNAAPSWQDLVPKQPSSGTRATAKLGSTLSRLQNETEEVWRLEQERRNLIDKAFVPRFEANETYDAFDFTLQKQALDFQKIRFPKLKDRFKEVKLDPLLLWKVCVRWSNFSAGNSPPLCIFSNFRTPAPCHILSAPTDPS